MRKKTPLRRKAVRTDLGSAIRSRSGPALVAVAVPCATVFIFPLIFAFTDTSSLPAPGASVTTSSRPRLLAVLRAARLGWRTMSSPSGVADDESALAAPNVATAGLAAALTGEPWHASPEHPMAAIDGTRPPARTS